MPDIFSPTAAHLSLHNVGFKRKVCILRKRRVYLQVGFAALQNYVNRKKSKSTIPGLITDKENNTEVLLVWYENFAEYEEALKSFIFKFKQTYKDVVKSSYN